MSLATTNFALQTDDIEFLVLYGEQAKPIGITQKDNLPSVVRQVDEHFNLNTEQMNLQLQFYDKIFNDFIDLDPGTWPKFEVQRQQLFNESSSEIKNDSKWRLKLVKREVQSPSSVPVRNQSVFSNEVSLA